MGRSMIRTGTIAALLLALAACGDSTPPAPQVDGRTQADWMRDVGSHDARIRAEAYLALARFEDPPLDVLAEGLKDERVRGRAAAMEALGSVGEAAAEHAKALAVYLEKDAEGFSEAHARQLRNAAMEALGQMGAGGFKAVAHLLVDRDPNLRARAAYTIKPLLASLEDGVGVLIPLVEDESWVVRREAVMGLGMCGKGNRRASTALLMALDDEDPRVVQHAAMSLGGIGGRSDHEGRALADHLFNHQTLVRAAAAYGLGLMGEEAAPYLKSVADLVKNDSKEFVRVHAALAHWRIGKSTELALPEIEKGLTSRDKVICREALKAIAAIGPGAKGLISTVVLHLADTDLRPYAASALGAIGPAAAEAVPALEATLEKTPKKDSALRAVLTKAVSEIQAQ
jgi:HEAT repeat protein